jgi:hypothetical protein
MIQNSGTLVPGTIVNIGFFVSGKVVAPDWLMGSIWVLDTCIVAGGNIAEPLDIAGIVKVAADGHERRSVIQEGNSQWMIFGPLQIGDGGTNPVYLKLDGTALEFPKQYDKTNKTVNYCSIDNVCGLKYYAGAGDTITHKNSVISSSSRFFWGLHASASLTGIYDFSGTSVIGAGTITLARAITITGLTINDYSTIDASGLLLTNSIIKGCPAATSSMTVTASTVLTNCDITVTGITAGNYWCSTSTPSTNFINCDFIGSATAGHAIYLPVGAAGGSFNLTGNTFTSFGADASTSAAIYNNSSGAVTITCAAGSGTPTIRNGAGASTTLVVAPVSATVIVLDLTTGNPIENARVLVTTSNGTGPMPYQETVTIVNSGTTATVSHTGHGMATGDKVLIAGGSLAANKGVFATTYISVDSYSYTMSSTPGSNPTGTITSTYVALEGLTSVLGVITMSRAFETDQPITGWARKSTDTPYYQQGAITGTISSTTGFSTTVQLVEN